LAPNLPKRERSCLFFDISEINCVFNLIENSGCVDFKKNERLPLFISAKRVN
jgi:hypothetical protein